MSSLCLIVARDPELLGSLQHATGQCGLKSFVVRTAAAAYELGAQWHFQVVVVDGDGFLVSLPQFLPSLSARVRAPILVLSARDDEEFQLAALDCGATEVALKPMSARLVAAKLRRLVDVAGERRKELQEEVRCGSLTLQPRRASAMIDGLSLTLTNGEFELLLLLAARPGEFMDRERIARSLRVVGATVSAGEGTRTVDMHVCRIRKKLRQSGVRDLVLETVYGKGYVLRCLSAKKCSVETCDELVTED